MADTRKDKRAPISLKVRFKSATLDEFIEQYSVDISRGGIFIKSKSPMSVGTLLKFEFRLKDESRLIHGVGRVVWKRESENEAGKAPGMGIKFIKMDPDSRSLVEQMVAKRGDAPGRFEEGQDGEPAAPSSGGFFPSTTPESELPAPEDRTQVRHASEFLASALAEGGSESASREAEKKAEEARKRTEEIEQKRAAEKTKRKAPRLKKTLVGVGVPEEVADEPRAEATGEQATGDQATGDQATGDHASDAEKTADGERTVSEFAETMALPREALTARAEETQADAAEAQTDSDEDPKADDAGATEEPAETEADEPVAASDEPVAAKPVVEDEEAARPPKAAETKKPTEERRPAIKVPQAEPVEQPSSRAGMVFFGLITAAAVGLVVWFQMQPSETPSTDESTTIGAQPSLTDEPLPDELAPELPEEVVEEAIPTTSVQVVTTPPGATVTVNGEARGVSPLEVELPLGEPATVETRLDGYASTSQEVTASEEQAPVEIELTQLAYVIQVETTPPGARVRSAAGTLVAPGELTLPRPPTGPISLDATLRGHQNASASVALDSFTETDGKMLATVTLALEEVQRPTPPRAPRPPVAEPRDTTPSAPAQPAGGNENAGETGSAAEPAPASAPAPAPEPAPTPAPEPAPAAEATPENPFG